VELAWESQSRVYTVLVERALEMYCKANGCIDRPRQPADGVFDEWNERTSWNYQHWDILDECS